jgi:hypothetical protein
MPRQRWPNTQLWQRSKAALRYINGKSWRRGGEWIFGVGRGELRSLIDCEQPEEMMVYIEDTIQAALREFAADMKARALASENAVTEFDSDSSLRRWQVKSAHIREMDELVDAFCMDWYEKNAMKQETA